jgi:hypothetical protein
MELAALALYALACSTAMSILAFMVGRCGRKLPIDGMLPALSTAHASIPTRTGHAPRRNPRDPTGPTPTERHASSYPPCRCSAAADQQVMRDPCPRGPHPRAPLTGAVFSRPLKSAASR